MPGSQRPELVVADATASPTTLDPFKVYGTQAQSFFRLIFEPLFDRDPDGKIRTPLLERWGPVDQLTWEFRLRPGVRFHDGGELTAADVVYSLERILDPQINSPRRHEFGELDTIVAVDPLTVRITTKRPYALLPARLSQFSMILPDQLRGRSGSRLLPGADRAGPLPARGARFDSRPCSRRSPDYHGGAPKIPTVVFQFIPDPEERLRQLLAGSVDIVTNLLPQQVDSLLRARGVRLRQAQLDPVHGCSHRQSRNGPLARAEVRRALLHGTDVEGLVRYVARGNGRRDRHGHAAGGLRLQPGPQALPLRSGQGEGPSRRGRLPRRISPAGSCDARHPDAGHGAGPAVGEARREARRHRGGARAPRCPGGSRSAISTTS